MPAEQPDRAETRRARLVCEAGRLIPEALVEALLGILVVAAIVGVVVLVAWGWDLVYPLI
ncbi:MAG TPA: hypothetical protein VM677_16635 [Actinokineospora sp.]|nr:hypothetical protein [Actinokineospora sp.]